MWFWPVVLALLAALTGGALSTTAGAVVPPERERLFVGRSFEGLPLTASESLSGETFDFIYGDCQPPAGEGGCAPPLTVQSWSICRRHPLEIDVRPRRVLRLRGVPVIDYGDRLEVLSGRTTSVLFGARALIRRAAVALRPVRGPAMSNRPLPAPRLPRWALRELKLIQVLRSRGASRRALRARLGISVAAIRSRERLAGVFAARLRGVPPATTPPSEIIGDRHALGIVDQFGADNATPEQRRRAERHRRRLQACEAQGS